jgi:hypothetical protein
VTSPFAIRDTVVSGPAEDSASAAGSVGMAGRGGVRIQWSESRHCPLRSMLLSHRALRAGCLAGWSRSPVAEVVVETWRGSPAVATACPASMVIMATMKAGDAVAMGKADGIAEDEL